jgi:hypothetical protein
MLTPDTATNAPVLNALRRRAVAENPKSGYTVDGYEVRTHPDVVDRLRELMTYTPDAQQFQYVFGTPTLSTPSGVIFATAGGTSTLCLRLPGAAEWGRSYGDYDGEPWRQGSAWGMGEPSAKEEEERFAQLLRTAYSSPLQTD